MSHHSRVLVAMAEKCDSDESASIDAGTQNYIPKEPKKKRFVSYLWDTFDKPPEERRLLSKLDAAIISFASIGSFGQDSTRNTSHELSRIFREKYRPVQYQQCVRVGDVCTVFVRQPWIFLTDFHRKEDLDLYKNQLNYIQAAWTIGYMVGQVPSNIILSRTRPRYWIPTLEVRALIEPLTIIID